MKIVFFGDSITDMNHILVSPINGESRDGWPYGLGMGFVFMATAELQTNRNDVQVLNRGHGGDTVRDLLNRIDDVTSLQPDVVNILVGANDVWQHLDDPMAHMDSYRDDYEKILQIIHEKLPNAKVMLCEPFVLHGSGTDGNYQSFTAMYDYSKVVQSLANQYNCVFVPMQQALTDKVGTISTTSLLVDGVHPNPAGAKIIARQWLLAFNKMGI